jgi:hypothetical protein
MFKTKRWKTERTRKELYLLSEKKNDGVFVEYLSVSETCFAVIKHAGIFWCDRFDKCVRITLL